MVTQHITKLFMWSVAALGAATVLYSAYHLPIALLDLSFFFLTIIVACSSRTVIKIAIINGHTTLADTFIFLALFLYGGEAAVLLAILEAACSSYGMTKKLVTFCFNLSVMACSTFAAWGAMHLCFGSVTALPTTADMGTFVGATCVMALVHYLVNTTVVATAVALKSSEPIWQTWVKHYLWTSVTYFGGATAAAITAKLIHGFGFYTVLAATPIIVIVYFTYKMYLKNVEVAAAHAAQAERHVAELSHYIAEQERMREQVAQMEKLSSLGELASGVAHDFNNTLAAILGRAQLMMRTNDPEKIRRGLQIIIKSATDGANTVKRIQDFARQRRDQDFALVGIDELLIDVSEITSPRWKHQAEAVQVHIDLDLQAESRAFVMGDASELRDVLVNMVFNAVDAMPKGGTLTLAAAERDGKVEVSVSDTGMGISSEVRSRIFDPFFTTKGKAGIGLGLSVSYGIICRHQGTVEVDSELGRGTTFRIYLPTAQCTATAPSIEAQVSSEPAVVIGMGEVATQLEPSQQPKFLVVDDEEDVRELLRDILESEGCAVVCAASGGEALGVFEAGRFDAVFTDVGMPGMSGWELARHIRQHDDQVPIAVITGWGEAVGSAEQQEARVNWVVTKPFTANRIAGLVAEVARHRRDAKSNYKVYLNAAA